MVHKIILPVMAYSPSEVARLQRELKSIDDHLHQLRLRKSTSHKLPSTSQLMEELASVNKLNLLKAKDRELLINFLDKVMTSSPVLHMSFSADPPPAFIEKLMVWLRREIHPQALVTTGLQPNIGAGCILRTTNKYFDLSLRESFNRNRDTLIKRLHREVSHE